MTQPTIRRAAVIGSGVMGSGIAAHLANSGIPCLLLDVAPAQLTEEEAKLGLTLEHPSVRNRLANAAIAKMKKTNPAPLYAEEFAQRITPGNLEDDLPRIAEADWVIEVIVEKLEAKRQLFGRIEPYWRPGIVVSSNTSGISINEMAKERSEGFRGHFMGTHFFNPPRYMKLIEIIPGHDTDPELVKRMKAFCETKLGKGVVLAKDTPNFIANRIGTYGMLAVLREMAEKGYTVEEIDAATGPAMGRPKSASMRTLDLVGLDTFEHVVDNVRNNVADPAEQALFETPEAVRELVKGGRLGEKSGAGFYCKRKGADGKNEILALDPATMEYRPQRKPSAGSLEASKQAKGTRAKIQALLGGGDRYSELAWNVLKRTLLYSASKAYEIADSIEEIDKAMRWGFNWELGPFETWDAIGLVPSAKRMAAEGESLPEWVAAWIAEGHTSFYSQEQGVRSYAHEGRWRKEEQRAEIVSLKGLKEQGRTIKGNGGASLIDLGDGVACLEFHSPNNAIGADILTMISQSVDEVRRNYEGLVIANEGRNFCVGANLMLLLMEAQEQEWEEIDGIIRQFQNAMLKLKRLEKPVVAAPHRMTLGGGVEACLPADLVVASPETYYGLVEVGVGLIPAGGGCKEFALRASESAASLPGSDVQPYVIRSFETIGMAKVSTSGHDAKKLGYLRETDRVAANPDHRIYEAKQAVLRMVQGGYEPVPERKLAVAGAEGKAVLTLGAIGMRESGYISDHDLKIAKKLAHVLAGGDLPAGTLVSEQYMLDLEREAFLSLCGEPLTQQRMQHMLTKGKALRN
ncbi:3-hydroxyacyl-CoA dehydrogenase/enoyl-CoA hydratase family protein [Cohnella thailandensis]|uniref:Enoyl-CoA hydratase/isomerase family protein n=1 Tax=Cohnella thailandensis TaxID=557557 RepID=A0A841T4D5_9BACL|nr:3-hydroxyacyl-CoA dehydrogenase/enoyl-CoA hydratase family protein [Cohnella thailandensis]MBB6637859.1 enoyl-CoA hydratase/isomerase family protein [Cohnella thailandensis]MBP1977434.1 3-hydroxyacyl-CoA dehydrogenase [Cohnella thailandensis]